MALGLQPHHDGDIRGIDVQSAHDAMQFGNFVFMVDRKGADCVSLERQADVGLSLDRMHVQQFGGPGELAHRGELGG